MAALKKHQRRGSVRHIIGSHPFRLKCVNSQVSITTSFLRLAFVALVCIVVLSSRTTSAAPPKRAAVKPGIRKLLKLDEEFIAPIGTAQCKLAAGAKVDIHLMTGKKIEQVELTELLPGSRKHSFKVIGYRSAKGTKQKLQATAVTHLTTDDNQYDLAQDFLTKTVVALDLKLRDEQTKERLSQSGHALWEDSTDEERKASIAEERQLFQKTQELFPGRSFHFQETEFFLFLTDMPEEQISGYIANLDAMYHQLCIAFGVVPGKNIWKGKCPIIAFQDTESFRRFEVTLMKNTDPVGAQGLHHGWEDGRVVISVARGYDPAFFATVLVHETAHGFLHRFRSNVHIVPWLNEGIADWIAGVAVPASNVVGRRQSDGIAFMRSRGSMDGFFNEGKSFNQTDYGIASSLTQFMLQSDPDLYRAFLTAIKEGYSIEDSIRLVYDCTPMDLVRGFGESIGVPELHP